jgi:formate hydrogenlyase subunit 3/multisubunit Na+/H+ antiporter MnhD subunit
MVAMNRDSVLSTEAAMKYFVLGALASGMLLYGMSMIYGGDVRFGAFVAQDWRLHLIDVSLVMQDMVDLLPVQLSAWKARSGR